MPPLPPADTVWVEVPIEDDYSDGDPSHRPPIPPYSPCDPGLYLEKLARKWMEDRGDIQTGESYVLDRLPAGYALFDRPRPSNPEIRDRYLYGHPKHLYFDSPNRFWPHFKFLMDGGSKPCACDNCISNKNKKMEDKSKTKVPGRRGRPRLVDRALLMPDRPKGSPTPGTSGRRGRPRLEDRGVVDEEGTADVFKLFVQRLRKGASLEETISERTSMDWRAERNLLPTMIDRVVLQHAFIPRVGELVLWCRELEGDLVQDPESGQHLQYSFDDKRFLGTPEWLAGTIAETPEERVDYKDMLLEPEKKYALSSSGFRVEAFPDPNVIQKSYSKQYKYVPLRQIRPLSYWQNILTGIPDADLHPTIKYALTAMSSLSLVEKYKIHGTWPHATIFSKGFYLGAELLVVGDAVRLKPTNDSPDNVTDVLVINTIRLNLSLSDTHLPEVSPKLSETSTIRLVGKAYTLNKSRAHNHTRLTHDEIIAAFPASSMSSYGEWFPLHSPQSLYEVSYDMVLGRCYEADAMRLWFSAPDTSRSETQSLLSADLSSIRSARQYSALTDERIPESRSWFWGDSRAQCLALETLNGLEVGKYDDARSPKMWRANLRIVDGVAGKLDMKDAKLPRELGRPIVGLEAGGAHGSGSSRFGSIGRTSSLVASALEGVEDEAVKDSESSGNEITVAGPDLLISAERGNMAGPVSESESETGGSESEGEEDEELLPPLLIRGGTEEDSEGDYRPEPKRQRTGSP